MPMSELRSEWAFAYLLLRGIFFSFKNEDIAIIKIRNNLYTKKFLETG